MNSVAPVWDGNETWLVLGGGGLLAAFPLAYAVVMPALYTPIIAMLLGLVFRGVAFEFRWRDHAGRAQCWEVAFAGGSLVAALAQGIALGALLQGIHVEGRALCRRLVGLADAVQHADRRALASATRCWARLAGHQDRRSAARQGLAPQLVSAVRDDRRHRRGQRGDAVPAIQYIERWSPGRASS